MFTIFRVSGYLVSIFVLIINYGTCTISGLSYMNPYGFSYQQNKPQGYNPCNPPFWYPKHIPEYCYTTTTIKPYNGNITRRVNLPIPIPQPIPVPIPLPYGVPIAPSYPMIPFGSVPYPSYSYPHRPASMVPGIPGLVSPGGGINIMPFSDAYSELLEKHKQKMIRKRFEKVLKEYERFPWLRRYRKRRREKKHF